MFLWFGTIANKPKTLKKLLDAIHSSLLSSKENISAPQPVTYISQVENYINEIQDDIKTILPEQKKYLSRWISIKLIDENASINKALKSNLNIDIENNASLQEKLLKIKSRLQEDGLNLSSLRDSIVSSIVSKAEEIRKKTCKFADEKYNLKNRKIDKILTSKKFGIPIMLAFLAVIFWITITGANYPSTLLSNFFGYIQDKLLVLFNNLHVPEFLTNVLIYRYVSDCNLGCFCYVTTYGYILPSFYFA